MSTPPPYVVQLEQHTALRLAQQGATLLFLDVPNGTVFNLDQKTFVVGPNFKGVKMIPPGPHFVGYSVVSKEREMAPPIYFFLHLDAQQVVCRRWDPSTELFLPLQDQDEILSGVRRFDFDQGLAPYDLQSRAAWQGLSGHLTPKLIDKLLPKGLAQSSIIAETDTYSQGPPTPAEQRLEEQLGRPAAIVHAGSHLTSPGPIRDTCIQWRRQPPANTNSDVGTCNYTHIPRSLKVEGQSVEQLTLLNFDKSHLLVRLLKASYGGDQHELVGELQFAFIAFLMGQSLQGFMQWKAILNTALGCSVAVVDRPQLFVALLKALHAQLALALPSTSQPEPDGAMNHAFMEGLMDGQNFLHAMITGFCQRIEEHERLDAQLLAALNEVRDLLQQRLEWEWDDADDEYAPVYVDL